MKTLYNYIRDINISTTLTEASLLDEIDDIIATGDELVKKKEIVEWLEENADFAYVFKSYIQNERMFKDPKQLKLDDKGQIDLEVFKEYNAYAEKDYKYLSLPIPEYIKLNNVNIYDFIGHKKDLIKIDFNKLPHINLCNNVFFRCWDGGMGAWVPNLSKLNVDEIKILTIDIEGVHPQEWPKNVKCVYLFASALTNYKEEYLEKCGYNYNLHNLNTLNTESLVIPDYFITENIAFSPMQNAIKKDIIIDKETFPYEWQNLNVIFNTKSFKNLYVYSGSSHISNHKYKEIKKTGDSYVIKGRATNVFNKYHKI